MTAFKGISMATGLSLVLTAAAAGPVLATHNAPVKAKSIKVDLATAYNACTGTPNDTQGTTLPLPACHPPVPTTNTNPTHKLSFGPKGSANLAVSAGNGDLKLSVKSSDILDNGVTIADGQQVGLHIDHTISTADSCSSGDTNGCTTIDVGPLFNNQFKATCTSGKCTLKTTVNTLSPGQISAGDRVNITFAGVGINDQDGDLAFSEGLFIP
jgi:hypothetical protein